MRDIVLHGRLRDTYGPKFRLDVASVHEAVRALCANFPQFYGDIIQGHYRVIAGSRRKGERLDEQMLPFHLPKGQSIHIIPAIRGAKNGGVGKIIAGIAMVAVAVAAPMAGLAVGSQLWTSLGLIGASLAFSGIAQLLTPVPKTPQASERPADRPSFLLGGAVNVTEQGYPIPIIGGEMIVGGIVISAGVSVERMP
jgi:predicted phage tail protein